MGNRRGLRPKQARVADSVTRRERKRALDWRYDDLPWPPNPAEPQPEWSDDELDHVAVLAQHLRRTRRQRLHRQQALDFVAQATALPIKRIATRIHDLQAKARKGGRGERARHLYRARLDTWKRDNGVDAYARVTDALGKILRARDFRQ